MNDIIQAISSVGFPIVLTLILIFQNNQKMDKSTEAIAENTKQLVLLIEKLNSQEVHHDN